MKSLVALVIVAGAVLAWQMNAQRVSLEEQHRRLDGLNARLDAKPKTTNIDLQEKCAKQAREQYRQDGWDKVWSASLQNHYSDKLGKCFMLVVSMDMKSGTTSKTLTDAFEGRVFANYTWRADKVKKYWEVPPVQCDVALPSGETTYCKSSDEFETLVKAYLE